MIDVEAATPEDLAAIRALLDANELPVQDLVESAATFLVARVDGVVAGVVGLEAFGASALLRSLCVAGGSRNRGIARSLCAAIESVARGLGVRELYLLTTTARAFFERRGFAVGTRDVAPSEIRATAEFRDSVSVDRHVHAQAAVAGVSQRGARQRRSAASPAAAHER